MSLDFAFAGLSGGAPRVAPARSCTSWGNRGGGGTCRGWRDATAREGSGVEVLFFQCNLERALARGGAGGAALSGSWGRAGREVAASAALAAHVRREAAVAGVSDDRSSTGRVAAVPGRAASFAPRVGARPARVDGFIRVDGPGGRRRLRRGAGCASQTQRGATRTCERPDLDDVLVEVVKVRV